MPEFLNTQYRILHYAYTPIRSCIKKYDFIRLAIAQYLRKSSKINKNEK